MVTVGYLIRLVAKHGKETDVERILQNTLARVQKEPGITAWFGFRLGPSTFGIFDAFPDEDQRLTHFSEETLARMQQADELLAQPRIMEKVDILAAKLPKEGAGNMVTKGFLIRYEVKSGKEADAERAPQKSLPAIQEEPATIAWFAIRPGPSTFGVFEVFPDEEGRQAHWSARAAQLQRPEFVENSLVVEKVDVVAAKLPG